VSEVLQARKRAGLGLARETLIRIVSPYLALSNAIHPRVSLAIVLPWPDHHCPQHLYACFVLYAWNFSVFLLTSLSVYFVMKVVSGDRTDPGAGVTVRPPL